MRGVQRTQACSVPKRWFRSRVSSHIIERLTIGHVASSPPLGVLLTLKFFATYCLSSRAANRTASQRFHSQNAQTSSRQSADSSSGSRHADLCVGLHNHRVHRRRLVTAV